MDSADLDVMLKAWSSHQVSTKALLRSAHAQIIGDREGHHALSVYRKLEAGRVPRDRVVFETTIAAAARAREPAFAVKVFKDMVAMSRANASLAPTTKACSCLISAFGQPGMADPSKAEVVFGKMQANRLKADSYTWTALAKAYVYAGDLEGAVAKLEVMEAMRKEEGKAPDPDTIFTYSAVMDGFANASDPVGARAVFDMMVEAGVAPDVTACNLLVKAHAMVGHITGALAMVERMSEWKLQPDDYTETHLISAFLNAGDRAGALSRLRAMKKPIAVGYALVMRSYLEAGDPGKALALFREMRDAGIPPTGAACNTACVALGRVGNVAGLDALFQTMRTSHLNNRVGYTVAMEAFGLMGHPKKAVALFREMRALGIDPDVPSATAVIQACARGGDGVVAERLLQEAVDAGVQPTATMRGFVVNAYFKAGATAKAEALRQAMLASGVPVDEDLYGGMLNTLAERGDPVEAMRLYEEMGTRVPAPLNAVIAGSVMKAFRKAGKPEGAEDWFWKTVVPRNPEARFRFSLWSELIRGHDANGRPGDAMRLVGDAIREKAMVATAGYDAHENLLDFHLCKVAARPDQEQNPEAGVPAYVVRALLGYHRAQGHLDAGTTYVVGMGGLDRVTAAALEDLRRHGALYGEHPDNRGLLVPLQVLDGNITPPVSPAPTGPSGRLGRH